MAHTGLLGGCSTVDMTGGRCNGTGGGGGGDGRGGGGGGGGILVRDSSTLIIRMCSVALLMVPPQRS